MNHINKKIQIFKINIKNIQIKNVISYKKFEP